MQETKECPVVVDIMGIVLGVIGAIVAIGLFLILLWKVFTTIHDRREFARFEKERMLAKYTSVRDWVYTRLGNDLVTGVRRARPYDVQVYFSLVHLFCARCNLFVIFIAK